MVFGFSPERCSASLRKQRSPSPESARLGVKEYFGAFAAGSAARHDHGSVYMSDHFQGEIQFLGMEPSPSAGKGTPPVPKSATLRTDARL